MSIVAKWATNNNNKKNNNKRFQSQNVKDIYVATCIYRRVCDVPHLEICIFTERYNFFTEIYGIRYTSFDYL